MFQGNEKNPLAKFVIMNSYPGEFKPAKSSTVLSVCVMLILSTFIQSNL